VFLHYSYRSLRDSVRG